MFLRLPEAGAVIALDSRPDEARNPPHFGLPLVSGEDLDDAVATVEHAGSRVVERGEHAPGIEYAYVADPDGNVLEL